MLQTRRLLCGLLMLQLQLGAGWMLAPCRMCLSKQKVSQDSRRHIFSSPPYPAARREVIGAVAAAIATFLLPASGRAALDLRNNVGGIDVESLANYNEPEITSRALMRISNNGKDAGVIIIGLYGKAAPKTVANFEALVSGENEGGYTYQGTTFYRIVSGLNLQAGAIGDTAGKGLIGTSATGEPFPEENFDVKHTAEGCISMAHTPAGLCDSRFFFTVKASAGWADGRYVAFGRILEGMDVLRGLETVPVQSPSNKPKKPVVIEECVLLPPVTQS